MSCMIGYLTVAECTAAAASCSCSLELESLEKRSIKSRNRLMIKSQLLGSCYFNYVISTLSAIMYKNYPNLR